MGDADDPDAASMAAEAHLVPRPLRSLLLKLSGPFIQALRSLLPNWDPELGRRMLGKYFLVDGNFIHYNVGNPDPVLIYSKDSMHQVSAGANIDIPPFKSILDEDRK